MDINNSCFLTMTDAELSEIGGGLAWWAVTLIVVGCCSAFGLGVYNGYKDTSSGN